MFRDDLVFLIFLYQRYIYPIDKKRANEFGCAPCIPVHSPAQSCAQRRHLLLIPASLGESGSLPGMLLLVMS